MAMRLQVELSLNRSVYNILTTVYRLVKIHCHIYKQVKCKVIVKSFTGCERREIWSGVCRTSLDMAWQILIQ